MKGIVQPSKCNSHQKEDRDERNAGTAKQIESSNPHGKSSVRQPTVTTAEPLVFFQKMNPMPSNVYSGDRYHPSSSL
jgi:hypothetical protein